MWDQILVVGGVTLLVLLAPGPDMIIVMRNTVAGGRSAGHWTALGILCGNLVHIGYSVVGIGILISQSIVVFSILKFAAAVYLVYLGISSILGGNTGMRLDADKPESANKHWIVQGFVNNVLNPKGALFYLGVFTTVIDAETTVPATVLLALIILSMCTLFWFLFVHTLGMELVRTSIVKIQTPVRRVFGVLLIALGLRTAALPTYE